MSTSSIKITQLSSIGANISHITIAPVVDMAGTPETKRATLQQVGNLILSNAGGTDFAPANVALIAQSVSNAAQPNITSVGTLANLSVSGNVAAGNLNGGNLVSANFFSGDGGLLSNLSISTGIVDNGSSSIEIEENAQIRFTVAGSANVAVVDTSGISVQGVVKTVPVLFSALPDPEVAGAGARAFVLNSSATTFGAVADGDGSNIMPVFSNGVEWLIG